jgi:formylglycine-generating enzyme required for sulfatase activity
VEHPVYWKCDDNGEWLCRHFAQWKPLDSGAAMFHVNWFEAMAFCRWAGRRLPTEAEWEWAAGNGKQKRHYPWGETPPTTSVAHFDWQELGPADVAGQATVPRGADRCWATFGNGPRRRLNPIPASLPVLTRTTRARASAIARCSAGAAGPHVHA